MGFLVVVVGSGVFGGLEPTYATLNYLKQWFSPKIPPLSSSSSSSSSAVRCFLLYLILIVLPSACCVRFMYCRSQDLGISSMDCVFSRWFYHNAKHS